MRLGFALRSEHVPELRRRLNCFAEERLRPEDMEPTLEYDLELPLHEIGPPLWDALCRLEPFGAGNPQPVFIARRARSLAPARILKGKHLKLKLERGVDGSFRPGSRHRGARLGHGRPVRRQSVRGGPVAGHRLHHRAQQPSAISAGTCSLTCVIGRAANSASSSEWCALVDAAGEFYTVYDSRLIAEQGNR